MQLYRGGATLVIGYRLSGAETAIQGSGAPAGEVEIRGTITIAGQDVDRHVISLDGIDVAVFYGQPGTVLAAGDLEFALRLDDFSEGANGLSPQIQNEADFILSSLAIDGGSGCSAASAQ